MIGTEASGEPDTQPPHRPGVRRWDTTTKLVVSVVLFVLAVVALYIFRIVFIPLIIGTIVAYIVSPLVRWLSTNARIPRRLATALVYVILLAILIPLPASAVPWLINQIGFFQGELLTFSAYLDTISADTVDIMGFSLAVADIVDGVRSAITDFVTTAAPASLSLVFNAAEVLLLIVFTVLIAFYLTRDSDRVVAWFAGLVPESYKEDAGRLIAEIDGIWSAFLRGQLILMLVVSVILTLAAAILGLPQPLLLGLLGGFLEFLPSVGHAIWLVTASALALFEGSATLPVSNFVFFLIVVGFHVAYTQFDLNFLIPHIIGRQVHLHPMIIILGIIIGATAGHLVGGPVGSVLGVALAAPTIASGRVFGRYIHARLFDLDPFPMVGPPSAPPHEREQAAIALAAAASTPPPGNVLRQEVSTRLRRHLRDPDAGSSEDGG